MGKKKPGYTSWEKIKRNIHLMWSSKTATKHTRQINQWSKREATSSYQPIPFGKYLDWCSIDWIHRIKNCFAGKSLNFSKSNHIPNVYHFLYTLLLKALTKREEYFYTGNPIIMTKFETNLYTRKLTGNLYWGWISYLYRNKL